MSEQPPWNPYSQQDPGQYPGQPPYQGHPYQGQPYQAPPGQPPYQGPPFQGQPQYGPPNGQQAYPAPGYGPQAPGPRRKRHLVRNILAGIGAVVIASIAISALASHSSGVSATSGNSTATPEALAALVGSRFDIHDNSGDSYQVTLVKVIDPAQPGDEFSAPDNGKRLVGAVFTIKAVSGSPQDEDADNDAALIASNGQACSADLNNIARYTNFSDGAIHVAQGEATTGAVAFQVPDGVTVTRVQWTAASGFGCMVQWDVRG